MAQYKHQQDKHQQDKHQIEPLVYRVDKPGLLKVLGELEAEIMAVIWEHPVDYRITVREVHEVLRRRRSIAYTTVMTTMSRLAKKKLLVAQKADQAYTYHPNVSEAEFTSHFVGQILDQLIVNFPGAAIAHLAEMVEPEQKDALARLLRYIVNRQGSAAFAEP